MNNNVHNIINTSLSDSELDKVKILFDNWRQTKKHRSEKIPQYLIDELKSLLAKNIYTPNKIIQTLSIDQKLIKKILPQKLEPNPELIGFKLLSDEEDFQTTQNNNQSLSITTSNGAKLLLPTTLDPNLLYKITELFLCSK